MIKDRLLKLFFNPVLGLSISYGSGIITYHKYNVFEIIAACFYFIFISFCIWTGCQWIHIKFRRWFRSSKKPMLKLLIISLASCLYACAIVLVLCMVWLLVSKEKFGWAPIYKFMLFSVLAVLVFNLVYEVLYLTKERQIDSEIVDQLDSELTHAELAVLRNELDPHFIYNSLNTLSSLITEDSDKADMFNNKLAEVYKYFLLNKEKELIAVEKEIGFIKDYFFLLQIRHDSKLELNFHFKNEMIADALIVPCALQILIENAIKHNQFSNEAPLKICIAADDEFLIVQNNAVRKNDTVDSTKIGIKNLRKQYLLVSNKRIIVEESENRFIVKLPLIKNKKQGV